MARILLSFSNSICDNGHYKLGSMYDQLTEELVLAGNELLLYLPNRFQKRMFESQNELLDGIDETKLQEDIKLFNPELIISFNNTMYNRLLEITSCPIILWGADTEYFWNAKDTIKQHLGRYYFFCFSQQEIKPRQELFKIQNDRIFWVTTATNIQNTHQIPDKNISFIGTCFSTNNLLAQLIKKYSGTDSLRQLLKNFKNYFFEQDIDLLYKISDSDFINDFNKIPIDNYTSFFSGEKRKHALLNICDMDLHIWGNPGWIDVVNFSPQLASCFHPQPVYSKQHNEYIYNTSKLCVNINHDQSINGINFRVLDVMASNACLVTSKSPFLDNIFNKCLRIPVWNKMFKKYIQIPSFNDAYEVRNICQKLLKNEAMRQDIVAASNEAIETKWRWHHRLVEIEQIMGINLHPKTLGKKIELLPTFINKKA